MGVCDAMPVWLLDYFHNRSQRTKLNSVTSSAIDINSSVVQGSALGLTMFLICSSDLRLARPGNLLCKYANDVTMVFPASLT